MMVLYATWRAPRTLARLLLLVVMVLGTSSALGQAFCAPPKAMPNDPPSEPRPALCQKQDCPNNCTASPCYVDSGIYVTDAVDLMLPTNGFPLLAARHYDSSGTVDGPMGIGWTSSLTPHLFYATYLYAPNTYQYEADVVMPDGARYRFSNNGDGTFAAPAGRRDALIRNADGTFTLTLQRSRSIYSFAADGTLSRLTDDFGNALAFTYTANGRIQTVSDVSGSGRSLTVSWNTQGRIADISDSFSPARHVVYSYDADGTLTGVRDPVTTSGDQSTKYAYTAGRYGPVLATIADRWNRIISRLTWRSDGKLASYTDGDFNDANPTMSTGEKYTYTYAGGYTYKQNSLGTVAHSYAPGGLITDHAGYDSEGNITSRVDGTNFWTTWYEYNSRGNMSKLTRYVPSDASHMCCTMLGYWNYTYDTNYPDQISAILPTGPEGNALRTFPVWLYEYNLPTETAPGALKRVKRYNMSRTATETMATYLYDAKGHIVSVADNLGRVSSYTYDAAGNVTSATIAGQTMTYGYDANGRITTATDAAGHTKSYAYDALDRIVSVTLPRPSSTPALPFVTTYAYGDTLENGLIYVTIADPNGHVRKYGYDALQNLTRIVDALGNATQYGYQYNLLKSVTDANANVTSYTYDANRNLVGKTFPDGATESYQVAWDGTVISSTDRRGIVTTYAYDSLGRTGSITYVNGSTTVGYTQFTYDGDLLTTVTSGPLTQRTGVVYTYDPFWRLASESENGYKITYENTTGFPSGGSGYTVAPLPGQSRPTRTVTYGLDTNQRVTSITWSAISGSFGIEYNALGQYSKITYPNGQTREFTYDDQGRLTTLANRAGFDNVATFQYGYDYDASGGATLLGQRTSMTTSGPATGNSLTRYEYDANYQLTRTTENGAIRTYQYDAIGNRVFAQYPWTFYKNGTNPQNGTRLRSDGGAAFTYDANGNMTGRVGQALYTWDYANHLITSNWGSLLTYTYDYLGRRTSTNWGGQLTTYISLGMNTIGERVDSTVRDYLFTPSIDEPLAMVENGVARYYAVDGLGSIVATTDASASVDAWGTYDAWGGVTYRAPSTTGLFGYTARENDVTGLLYYRARWYQSSHGRFLSEDPIGSASGDLHPYRYVENRPVGFTDPFGLAAQAPRTRRPVPPEPRKVPCTNCTPDIANRSRNSLTAICKNSRVNTACKQVLEKYHLFGCFRDRCMDDDGLPIRCIDEKGSCGGCAGPCNSVSDYTHALYLQPAAGSSLCGSLDNTLAHEMAHMCGIGADVRDDDPTEMQNRRRAEEVAYACGGPH